MSGKKERRPSKGKEDGKEANEARARSPSSSSPGGTRRRDSPSSPSQRSRGKKPENAPKGLSERADEKTLQKLERKGSGPAGSARKAVGFTPSASSSPIQQHKQQQQQQQQQQRDDVAEGKKSVRGVAGADAAGRRRALTRMASIVRPAETAADLLVEVDTWSAIEEILADATRVATHGSADAMQMGMTSDGIVASESLHGAHPHSDTLSLNSGVPERAVILGQAVNNDPAAVAQLLRGLAQKSKEMEQIRGNIKVLRIALKKERLFSAKRHDASEKRLRHQQSDELDRFIKDCNAEYKELERELLASIKALSKRAPAVSGPANQKADNLKKSKALDTFAEGPILRSCWFESGIESKFDGLVYKGDADNLKAWSALQVAIKEDTATQRARIRLYEKRESLTVLDDAKMEAAVKLSDKRLEHEKLLHDLERRQTAQMTDRWLDATLDEQKNARKLLAMAHKVLMDAMIAAQKLAEDFLKDFIHRKQWLGLKNRSAAEIKTSKKELASLVKDMKRTHAIEKKQAKGLSKADAKKLSDQHQAQIQKTAKEYRSKFEKKVADRENALATKQLEQQNTLQYSHRRFLARRARKFCSLERRVLRQQTELNRTHLQNTYDDAQKFVAELQADEAEMLRDEFGELTALSAEQRTQAITETRSDFAKFLKDWAQRTAPRSRSMLGLIRKSSAAVVEDLSQTNFADISPDGSIAAPLPHSRPPMLARSPLVPSAATRSQDGHDVNGFIHETVRQAVLAFGLRALRRRQQNTLHKQQRELEVWTEHRQQRIDFEDYWFHIFERILAMHGEEATKLAQEQWRWLHQIGLSFRASRSASKKAKGGEPDRLSSLERELRSKFGIKKEELIPKNQDTAPMAANHKKFVASVEAQWDIVRDALKARWRAEQEDNADAIESFLTGKPRTKKVPSSSNISFPGPQKKKSRSRKIQGKRTKQKVVVRKTISRPVTRKVKVVRKVRTRKTRVRSRKTKRTEETATAAALPEGVVCRVEVIHVYKPRKEGQLALDLGELVDVSRQKKSGWWEGCLVSIPEQRGKFPSNFVKVLSASDLGRLAGEIRDDSHSSSGGSMESYSTDTAQEVETTVDSFTDVETDVETEEDVEQDASDSDSISDEASSATPVGDAANMSMSADRSADMAKFTTHFSTFGKIAPEVLRAAQKSYADEQAADLGEDASSSAKGPRKAQWKAPTQIQRELRSRKNPLVRTQSDLGPADEMAHARQGGFVPTWNEGIDSDSDSELDEIDESQAAFATLSADNSARDALVAAQHGPNRPKLVTRAASARMSVRPPALQGAKSTAVLKPSAPPVAIPVPDFSNESDGATDSIGAESDSWQSGEEEGVDESLRDLEDLTAAALGGFSSSAASVNVAELAAELDFGDSGSDLGDEGLDALLSLVAGLGASEALNDASDYEDGNFSWESFLTSAAPKLSPESAKSIAHIFEDEDLVEEDMKMLSDEFLSSLGVSSAVDRRAVLDAAKSHLVQ